MQTTLTPAQEAIAVALRKTLLVSLDDLLSVVREFLNPDVSRSGLDRCLRRNDVGNLRDLKGKVVQPNKRTVQLAHHQQTVTRAELRTPAIHPFSPLTLWVIPETRPSQPSTS